MQLLAIKNLFKNSIIANFLKSISNLFYSVMPQENAKKLYEDVYNYWSASESSDRKRDLSHWRGKGRWDEEAWLEIGEINYSFFKMLCKISNTPTDSIKRMLEWGPGGGANVIRFAKNIPVYYGVDISKSNLDECHKQVKNIYSPSFHPILIEPLKPQDCIDKIEGKIDFFLSTAVFQHFPSRAYGIEILKIANNLLHKGKIALIQIRYDNMKLKYKSKTRAYQRNAITFTSYRIDEFWKICDDIGLEPLSVVLSTKVNYAYYFLQKK